MSKEYQILVDALARIVGNEREESWARIKAAELLRAILTSPVF